MKLILGSQSPSRRLALETAGYVFEEDFTLISPDIDEKQIRHPDFRKLPMLIAHAKADALVERLGICANTLLITGDQVVEYNGQLREKPESEAEAREFLASYRTGPAQTNSAVVVTNMETGIRASGIDIAMTHFKYLPDEVINVLAVDEGIRNSAGAFLIEHEVMAPYIDYISGDPDSVMGLPMGLVGQLIEAAR